MPCPAPSITNVKRNITGEIVSCDVLISSGELVNCSRMGAFIKKKSIGLERMMKEKQKAWVACNILRNPAFYYARENSKSHKNMGVPLYGHAYHYIYFFPHNINKGVEEKFTCSSSDQTFLPMCT